jgi:hypothetical protein
MKRKARPGVNPLADPRRARYVRAALDRRRVSDEQLALARLRADPERQAQAVSRVKGLLAMLGDST